VYNIIGGEITTLVDESLPGGLHTVNRIAEDFASGVYLYELETMSHRMARKLTIVK